MPWIEVFKTGTHTDSQGHTQKWTAAHLNKIVEVFEADQRAVPVVVGHPKTDSPAYGWVKDLKIQKNTLLAQIEPTVAQFKTWVNKKVYNSVSIALRADRSLRHVGFLGAVAPAIQGLKPPQFAEEDKDFMIYEFAKMEEEMTEEQKQIDALTKEKEALIEQAKLQEKAFNERDGQAEKNLRALRLNMRKMEFRQYLNEKLSYGTLTDEQVKKVEKIDGMLAGVEFSANEEFAAGAESLTKEFREFLLTLRAPIDKETEKKLTTEFAKKEKSTDSGTEESFTEVYQKYEKDNPEKTHKQITLMVFRDYPQFTKKEAK